MLTRALTCLVLVASAQALAARTRLKELTDVQGFRENALIGYGLVVGLTNTGDTEQVLFTMQSMAGLLGRLGVRIDPRDIRSRNVAAVMVTARLPTFGRPGAAIDVTVSAMGNARSLQGGTLLFTPLAGADGVVYAVGQGPVQVGGFDVAATYASVRKNSPASGTVPGGATIEKAVIPQLGSGPLTLRLRRADFTNASRIAAAINGAIGTGATVLDAAAVEVAVPAGQTAPELLARLEALEIDADVRAKVVVSERTGTVVLGEAVRLRPAAVAHGGLRVSIATSFGVSQPGPLANSAQTVVVPNQQADAKEEERSAVKVPPAGTVDELVSALNAIGAPPRDLIAILQALKAAGALDADIEVL
ncbi:MAG: flagellar basal body P-ring protein FlgI [Myxococcaceae bacterium]|jgi:flagellar P-ring protein precursor FlgI|nr:flagellar basal body P-ring protein FlgI [Myxococcaceae bacterium]